MMKKKEKKEKKNDSIHKKLYGIGKNKNDEIIWVVEKVRRKTEKPTALLKKNKNYAH